MRRRRPARGRATVPNARSEKSQRAGAGPRWMTIRSGGEMGSLCRVGEVRDSGYVRRKGYQPSHDSNRLGIGSSRPVTCGLDTATDLLESLASKFSERNRSANDARSRARLVQGSIRHSLRQLSADTSLRSAFGRNSLAELGVEHSSADNSITPPILILQVLTIIDISYSDGRTKRSGCQAIASSSTSIVIRLDRP